MTVHDPELGSRLRDWRRRRRMSQLDLALEAEISSRHLSFIETGRSSPSREMVLRLAESLAMPLRERNALLLAAGFAPDYPERPLDDPSLTAARAAVERIIHCHLPFPALAIDRHWNLVHCNAAVSGLIEGCAPHLLAPPVNVLRLSLHPEGLASRILNLGEWKHHLLDRIGQQIAASGDMQLEALRDELTAYPAPATSQPRKGASPIVAPLLIESAAGTLSFISTTTVFGTPVDVTLSEIAIESFFPADEATAERIRALG